MPAARLGLSNQEAGGWALEDLASGAAQQAGEIRSCIEKENKNALAYGRMNYRALCVDPSENPFQPAVSLLVSVSEQA